MRNCLKTFFALALVGVLLPISCATRKTAPPVATGNLVWPKPPDKPRICHLRNISIPSDAGSTRTGWKKLSAFITGETSGSESLVKPFGVALDESGNLCVADTGNNSVCLFDFSRKKWTRWESVGKTRFKSPVGVARSNCVIYVADSGLGNIIGFDERGRERLTIGAPLLHPAGIAIASGRLFVVDSHAHAVFIFDMNGKELLRFGKRGTGEGEFNFPTHVAVDVSGNILVTDSLNSRVQTFDALGKFKSQIGSAGDAPGHFGRPKGVAADSAGHVYIVDAVYDNVQIFDQSGRLLLNFGQGGAASGEFGVPAGIAISADDRIYVADSYNRRIQVFKYISEP